MDPRLQAQMDVRQQAEELHGYMKDLFGWQKELKAKEKSLKRGAAAAAEAAPLPPVRGRAAGVVNPAPAAGGAASSSAAAAATTAAAAPKHPSAHTYEHYRDKWEKYDVDAALASDDEESGRVAQPSGSRGSGGSAGASASRPHPAMPSASSPVPAASAAPAAAASKPLPAARLRAAAQAAAARAPAQPSTAEGWKDEGNRLFKAGSYQQAVDCYSSSLGLAPSCLAFANRAMARLKLGQFAEAEADCGEALGLDPSYVKAYQRRAAARKELGDLLGVIDDYEAALRLEPTNKTTCAERRACIEALMDREGLVWEEQRERLPVALAGAAPQAGPAGEAAGPTAGAPRQTVAAAAGPAAEAPRQAAVAATAGPGPGPHRAADGEVRIEAAASKQQAEEQQGVGASISAAKPSPAAPSSTVAEPADAAASRHSGQDRKVVLMEVGGEAGQEGGLSPLPPDQVPLPGPLSPPEQQEPPQQQQEQQQQQRQHAAQPLVEPAAAAAPQLVTPAVESVPAASGVAPAQQSEPAATAASTPSIAQAATAEAAAGTSAAGGTGGGAAVAAAVAGALKHATAVAGMKAPRTGLEFEKGWKACKGDRALQADYLQLIPPARLPAILKQSLTPALLAALLRTLLGPGAQRAPAHAAALLEALPGVARFDMNLMSLPAREKAGLREAWEQAQAQLAADADLAGRVAAAREHYKL